MKSLKLASLLALVMSLLPTVVLADTKVRTSSFEYDATGILTKEVIEPDSPNDCQQTTHGYDGFGNKTSLSASACAGASGYAVSSASTPRTDSSTFGTDGRFPLSTSNALGQSETKVFDARFGTVTSLTGPNGLTTTWEYDDFGRKTKETRSDGTYTTWSYLLCSQAGANCPGPIGGAAPAWTVIEQSYAVNAAVDGPEKRQFHDTLDRIIRVQTAGFDGAGAAPTLVQDTEYDNLNRVARKSQTYALNGGSPNWTEYTYDVLGRVVQERSPDPAGSGGYSTTTISYNGLTTTVTNSKGQTKTTTKNAQGQVAQVTDHAGNTVTYTYDALGQLTQTNAAGSITTIAYNQRGHKISMQDPAMGAWEYRYNAFGELVWQRDSLGQAATIAYDVLGRMVQRTEADLVSTWSYDKKFDGSACGKGVGKLCEAQADNGYKRTHTYDTLGRISTTATALDNPSQPATVSVSYDAATGRLVSKTWPTGYQASYEYTALGYLKKVTGGGTNGFTQTVTYEVLAMDARGRTTQYRQGNQITTVKNFDAQTGRLLGITATRDGQATGAVQSHTYTYDSLGNLTSRADNSPGVGTSETFAYDALNRLNLYTTMGGGVSPPQSTEVLYDVRGNILYKSDVGRYWYDPQRPNRLTNVTLETAPGATLANRGTRALSYAFDDYKPGAQTINGVTLGNGNLEYTVSQDTVNARHTYRGEIYTSFGMPKEITYGNFVNNAASTADRILSFVYGPEHQRIKQTVQLTSNNPTSYSAGTTWYLNGEDSLGLSYEKEVKASGTTEHKHYVSADGVVFALYTSRTGTATNATVRYFHHDHLGSTSTITDEGGQVAERLAYDPWGKRRNVNGVEDVLDSIVGWNTDRGFTMHEHLDEIGVIHMNGRVYDPLIGRFMSADPFIQEPEDLASHNRYSYVLNNPLGSTDPTGYFGEYGSTWASYNFNFGSSSDWFRSSSTSSGPSLINFSPSSDRGALSLATPNGQPLFGFSPSSSAWQPSFSWQPSFATPSGQSQFGLSQSFGSFPTVGYMSGGSPLGAGFAANRLTMGDVASNLWNSNENWIGLARTFATAAGKTTWNFVNLLGAGASGDSQWAADSWNALLHKDRGATITTSMLLVGGLAAPRTAAGLETGFAAKTAVADGKFYSVAFETRLSSASYPGVTRYMHFKEANAALDVAMQSNPALAKLGISVPKSPTGSILGKSPEGWVWHHDTAPGLVQLVPKSQHPNIPGGIFWETLHPGGGGGYSIWGK